MNAPRPIGLILAGGAGRRLGRVRKDQLRLGNIALLDRVRAILEPGCAAVIVSTGADALFAADLPNLPDDPAAVQGPAAGLLAGARWCTVQFPGAPMVSVPVDSPFFPADFPIRAAALLADGIGCVTGAYEGRDYPTSALWNPAALRQALEALPHAPRGPRVRDIQQALGVRHLDYANLTPLNPFAGINTLPELLSRARELDRRRN
ncbi:molybdenum cofactor guanylyltransferase [Pelagibacterium lacus]|uniref:Molybdenum cofactor guanylyltransferase MobA n=1 Tax=Pelagibacterium lacus TaxID=2282655 RepID=A0A369W3S1_9HYPH|nr:NTP transferase domain-containing protein [Pelagibacterium lacus]RDE09198.1 molybdenum cofactor guanylyltransferase MobA [Pelagibacterium lacus]